MGGHGIKYHMGIDKAIEVDWGSANFSFSYTCSLYHTMPYKNLGDSDFWEFYDGFKVVVEELQKSVLKGKGD